MLRRFAATFPNHAVCDLAKEHLDAFMQSKDMAALSPKSRNHHRTAIRQFLAWCVRKDYLPVTHRSFEADQMQPERANTAEVCFYTPGEFRVLLEAADDSMRPIIAIGGLAGLRTSELLRLDWADVWRVKGHIEVTAGKAKTRQRRLVEVCSALAACLAPYRAFTSGRLWTDTESVFQKRFRELCEHAGVTRRDNGLRHAFVTFHFAQHSNEALTAAQAGNTPQMVHSHYKGLATSPEAKKWFAVKPPKSAQNVIPLPALSRKQAQ
jgi:integrase